MTNKGMREQTIKFKVISPVSLSPRESLAFYKGLDYEKENIKKFYNGDLSEEKLDKINIIYPFYQYGEYLEINPQKANYYIPGSSFKGALMLKKEIKTFFVDDVDIKFEDIILKQLFKIQYLNHESKEVKMDYFFPNVGIEMLKVETNFEIQIYAPFDKEKVLCSVVNETKKKIEYSISILRELIKRAEGKNQDLRSNDLSKIGNLISQKDRYDNCNISKENIEDLKKVVSQLSKLKDKKILFLGGYKGLAHSIMNKRSTKDKGESNLDGYEGAFYIDNEETYLPFGLVEIL